MYEATGIVLSLTTTMDVGVAAPPFYSETHCSTWHWY